MFHAGECAQGLLHQRMTFAPLLVGDKTHTTGVSFFYKPSLSGKSCVYALISLMLTHVIPPKRF